MQRVSRAKVTIEGKVVGEIGVGMVVLLGVARGDSEREVEKLATKIVNLRVMKDKVGKMNLSLLDIGGGMLVVSQFTLLADTGRGRRPSFVGAAEPGEGERLYKLFSERVRRQGVEVSTGRFGAYMAVELINDGPVTILIDTEAG